MKKYFTLLATMFVALFTVGCGEWQNETPKIPYEDLPYFCDLENFQGWSNARICKDGSAVFTLDDAATQQVKKTLMLIPADTLGFVSVYGEFDETGFPKSLAFNDAVILIDNRADTTFNATVFVDSVAVWTAEDLAFTSESTRAWSDNNWVRNTCAVGGIITGAIGVGVGVALTGTGVGTMTGLVTIAGSCGALAENLGVLFGPPEETDISDEIEQYIQDKGWDNLCDGLTEHEEKFLNKWFKEHMDALDRLSWVDLALDLVDRFWGKTVTESQKRLALLIAHRSYVVETGIATNITNHTAELWGYVSPEALFPLNKPAEIEYGIIVYPTDNPSKRMHQQCFIGEGGAFSLLFRGLEYNTKYSYQVYYYDKTNAIPRYGQTRTFITNEEESLRQMLIQFYKDTGGDNWIHNFNWCSDKPLCDWYGVEYSNEMLGLYLDSNNLIGSGDLSGCTALGFLHCENNQLTSLDVSGCTALWSLECYNNQQLTSLNISGCTALKYLDCSKIQLTSLDVSGFTALKYLSCAGCQLTSLDVSGCTALEDLYCDGCQLTTLNASNCTVLKSLYCSNIQLTTLNVSNCTALVDLDCYNNQLTSLNVSGCTALEDLDCSGNQLTSLNVYGCTALSYLYCFDNQLTSLNASGCTALEHLDCFNNQLTSLNVSGCTGLWNLNCHDNQLTSLDVSSCTALKYLTCSNNPITQEITSFYESLVFFAYDTRYYYGTKWINGKIVYYWYYNFADQHGWYYPDEPKAGYSYGGYRGN